MREWFLIAALILTGCGDNSSQNIQDEYFNLAWHLHTPDREFAQQHNIVYDSHVHVLEAWRTTRGKDVRVAILDNYFNPSHPDIADRVILTYNASDGTTDVAPPHINTNNSHGQRVAGILAATANSKGVIGVAPEVKLILIGSSFESDADTIRALMFAKNSGAQVINCSWGSYSVSVAVSDVLQELYDANITVVFASGNGAKNLDNTLLDDESELPSVIGVSSSNEFNTKTVDADYGSELDILAPGGELIGLVTTDFTNYTTSFRGVSASAPVVSGAVALMLSIDPSLTPSQIRQKLITSADKIGSVEYTDGFNLHYAYGKLNISEALK